MDDAINQAELDALVQGVGDDGLARDRRYRVELSIFRGCPCLRISGMVLQAVPDEFTNRLRELVVEGGYPVIVDLRDCTYLCSSALGALIYIFSASPKVLLLRPNAKVATMLRLVGGDALVTTVPDEAAAEAELARLGH